MPEINSISLVSDANLKRYYRLENTSDEKGGTAFTNNGSVSFVTGLFSNCADFGTSNSTKSLSLSTNPLTSDQLANVSYSMWINVRTAPGSGVVYQIFENNTATGGGGMDPFFQYRNDSGTLRLRGGHVLSSSNPIHTYDVNLGTDTWYHVGLSVESTTTSKIFLNGVQVSTTTGVGTHTGSSAGSLGELTVAADRDGTQKGSFKVDDFAIFERVLTAGEWLSIYAAGGNPSGSPMFFSSGAVTLG